jgi:hypothetical protein
VVGRHELPPGDLADQPLRLLMMGVAFVEPGDQEGGIDEDQG